MITAEEFINACIKNNMAIVRQYIAEGGNVNVKSIYTGWTGLMYAAYYGHADCVRELIAAEVDINAKDNRGLTALMLAAYHGRIEFLRELIAAGANLNAVDNDGRTALARLLSDKKYDAAQLLVELGVDIYAKDNSGKPAIDRCKDENAKAKLIQLYQQRLNTEVAIASAEKPDIIKGFDPEL